MPRTRFTSEPGDAETRKELYLAMSDPVTGFINQHISEDPETFEVKQDLVNAFTQYCKQLGFVPISDRKFYEQLKKTLYLRDYRPKLYTTDHPEGKQVACYRGISLDGYNKSEYSESKEEYQAKHGKQSTLTPDYDRNHSDDSDHPQTPPESEIDQGEDQEPYYPHYAYSDDYELVELVKQYLQNNCGSVETSELVQHLLDQGYTFTDYQQLKQYTQIFTQEKTRIRLREDST